jgi:hypothetical protein
VLTAHARGACSPTSSMGTLDVPPRPLTPPLPLSLPAMADVDVTTDEFPGPEPLVDQGNQPLSIAACYSPSAHPRRHSRNSSCSTLFDMDTAPELGPSIWEIETEKRATIGTLPVHARRVPTVVRVASSKSSCARHFDADRPI